MDGRRKKGFLFNRHVRGTMHHHPLHIPHVLMNPAGLDGLTYSTVATEPTTQQPKQVRYSV